MVRVEEATNIIKNMAKGIEITNFILRGLWEYSLLRLNLQVTHVCSMVNS